MSDESLPRSDASSRTVTTSLESPVEPATVLAVLADARTLPRWAPLLADRVAHRSGADWTVTKGENTFDLAVVQHAEAGTVDFLRSVGEERIGAWFRTTTRPGGGSVTTMTMVVFDADVSASRSAAAHELAALVRLASGTEPT